MKNAQTWLHHISRDMEKMTTPKKIFFEGGLRKCFDAGLLDICSPYTRDVCYEFCRLPKKEKMEMKDTLTAKEQETFIFAMQAASLF